MKLEQAISLRRTNRSIIPLLPDKRPDTALVPSWKKYQTEHATEEEITSWYKNSDERNIGIVTGKISNLTVIDIDTHLGQEHADKVLKEFPETWTVRTGSGGYHLYYYYDASINAKNDRERHIDVKNDGGYIVAPFCTTESVIELNSKGEQIIKKQGGYYQPINTLGIQRLNPTILGEKIVRDNNHFDYNLLNGVEEGSRNNSLTSVIGHWLSITPKPLWSTILPMCHQWNSKLKNPLPTWEVDNTFKSIYSRESKKVRAIDENFQEEKSTEIILLKESAELHRQAITGEYVQTQITPLDSLINGIYPEHLIVISGYTGQGKSLFAMAMTKNILNANYPIMWLQFELTPSEFWDKYRIVGLKQDAPVYVPKVYKSSNLMKWVEDLIVQGLEKGIRYIVIDLLDFLVEQGKDRFGAEAQVATQLKLMATRYHITIILMAHMRKPEQVFGRKINKTGSVFDIKGAMEITGLANVVIGVTRLKRKKDSSDELDIEKNTPYTQFKVVKNRINGLTGDFFGSYQNGELELNTKEEVQAELGKEEDGYDDLLKQI